MSVQTTSNNETLMDLGLNPGSVDYHFNVSVQPVRFYKLGSLGWGYTYQAVHSCNLECHDGPEGEVDGLEFNVNKGEAVKDAWEKARAWENEKNWATEQEERENDWY